MTKHRLGFLWRSLLCGVCLAGLCSLTAPLQAQDGWDDEEEMTEGEDTMVEMVPWAESERKKEMERKMEDQIRQKRNEYLMIFTSSRVAEQIDNLVRRRFKDPKLGDFSLLRLPGIALDWKKNYNRPPAKSLEEIVEDIRMEAEDEAEARIRPEEQKAQIRAYAEEHFRMAALNERVSLTLRGGKGTSVDVVDKPFRAVNDEYVLLGNRQIIKEDLTPEDQARFYPDINAKMKEDYIVNQTGKVDVEYESTVDRYVYENTARAFRENFYVPDITKATASLRTAKPDFWLPMKDFVEKVRNTLVDRQVEQYKANELPLWMQQQGYFLVDKEDKSGKEWVDEAEKTRRETPPPPTDPNGMGNPMMNNMPPGMGNMPPGMQGRY